MKLIEVKSHKSKVISPSGHDGTNKHEGHDINIFKKRFWVSLVLTLLVLELSPGFRGLFGLARSELFSGDVWVQNAVALVVSSFIFFYGGLIFLTSAVRELRGRLPGMMTLIGIAISAAYLWSLYAVFADEETLFWELTTLITIMLLGHWLEMRAVSGAQGALKELSKLLPDTAERIRNYESGIRNNEELETEVVPLSDLKADDVILVRPGGKVPADGVVVNGESDVNESMITGESKPVAKKIDTAVIAGTINGDGALKIRVMNIGEKTFLAGVMRLVAEAQASKSRLQILSDRAALYLTFVAVFGGLITLIAWLAAGAEIGFAVARLVAVLVIACPHALGLAVPLVASISTTKAAQNGFLVKQRLALEAARTIDTVLFDKTGTLTKGEFGVVSVWGMPSHNEDDVLTLAASLDALSEHPIAKAVVTRAKAERLTLKESKKFEAIKGKGVKAMIVEKGNEKGEMEVMVGGSALLEGIGKDVPREFQKQAMQAGKNGQTIIYVVSGGQVVGGLALADIIRPESREAIVALKKLGVRTAVITGDSEDVAKWVSAELGIDEYFARVLPAEKSERVKGLQERGLKVAFVGDGINDAPALTQADLGIAIGAGTNVAIESAGIILVRNDPRDIVKIIRLSRLTYVKMIQNIFWATGYNVVALPLAAGALAWRGILLEPAVAAVFMSVSTVVVAVNAMLLRRQKL